MLLRSTLALAALSALSSTVSASLTPGGADQLVLSGGRKALDFAAQKLSNIGTTGGGGDVEAMTQWGWYDCGEPGDALEIEDIRISPDPPKPGHNLTIYASGAANTLVTHGSYADVTVKLGLIKLLTKRFDVCEELSNAKSTLQCPIEPDTYAIEQTVALPAEIPRAKFQVSARVFTQDEAPAACVDLWINFLVPDQ